MYNFNFCINIELRDMDSNNSEAEFFAIILYVSLQLQNIIIRLNLF